MRLTPLILFVALARLVAGEPPPAADLTKILLADPLRDVGRIVFAVRGIPDDGHWYANIGYYRDGPQRKAYGSGGRLCVLDPRSGELRILLDDPAGAVRDPAVDYDGRRILFSYRMGGTDTYHLFTIQADGSGLTRLTRGADYDDYEPCWLPDGGIAFVTTRCKRWVNCWVTQVGNIWRCDADGGNMRPLSANLEHDNTPWMLPDGRLLYTRWEYIDRSQMHYHHLWTMNPDGTGQMVYFGNYHPGGVFIDAKPIPGSDEVVLIHSPGHGRAEHAGQVATLKVRNGPDDPAGLRDLTKSASFRDPWAFAGGAIMAASDHRLVLLDGKGQETTLFTLPASFGRVALHEPRPLVARARENVLPSRVDLTKATGRDLVNDVRVGRNMAGVKAGEIKRLMIIEALPKPINFTGGMDPLSYAGTFTLERVLGTVPVEDDGSANFEVPALRSLLFVSLDAQGKSVKRMQSFTTVQPGETFSCIGCHEDRAATRVMGLNGTPAAARRPPSIIEPIRGVPDLPDFCRDVQPILDRHCVSCHDNVRRDGGVNLSGDHGPVFSLGYYALTVFGQLADGRNLARSNYPPHALGSGASPLVKKCEGGHHRVAMDARDQAIIRQWIDIGAPYPGTYAALGGGSVGGYLENEPVLHSDINRPATLAAQPVFAQRCVSCHRGDHPVAHALSDEMDLSFWKPDMRDPRLKFNRHVVFNLSQPAKSLVLLAPLSRAAGGLGLCHPADAPASSDSGVFATTDDPGYMLLLAMCESGKQQLDGFKRFDMPGFKPPPEYLREMQRYQILPPGFDPANDPIDVHALDRAYWDGFRYRPPTR